ncbi:NAD(P)/FAD-dependent oxidoreductase [Micromonospora sp. STR1_7]|uniref:NAD(P)/FAD-dependent oxidoreductase n=1 Tax=Micromonospora parastrephiae TaxID=2806101 RepID=A0ABS1XWC9_9ACTN|nr:NAD(P)/FAD-dependent oxidoreductase [Micromonospora parastrephiae]MBM0233577.1 NAD(P)/FAD-dependent oxidoreductase [Micromonospora parastrephiae]
MFDVIVIGGGPAGLSAALCLGRTHRSTLVLDTDEGRNAPAQNVHNFFTQDGTPPTEVRRIGAEQLGHYPSVRLQVAEVSGVERDGAEAFAVTLADGQVEHGRRLLLATGLADDLPAIDGIAPLWGRSAFHCPYCHGYEVSGHPIAVLGGTPDRVRLAVHLSRFTDDIVLCTDGPVEWPAPITGALEKAGVEVRTERVTAVRADGPELRAIQFETGPELERSAMFIKTVLRQRSPIAAQLGCAIFPDDAVEVNEFGQTSVPGVYAAGDMARRPTVPMPVSAVVVAAASGTIAAGIIDQDLLSADFDLPNPFANARS